MQSRCIVWPSIKRQLRQKCYGIPPTSHKISYFCNLSRFLLSSSSKLLRNLGNAMVRQGQFQDAIQSFESIMEESPDYKSGMRHETNKIKRVRSSNSILSLLCSSMFSYLTGLNLVICYFALAETENMRKSFQQLASYKYSRLVFISFIYLF